MNALFAEGFPAFITGDQEVKQHIGHVRELFGEYNIMLVDDDGEPEATGWGVPISWSSEIRDLPETFARVLERSLETFDASDVADTFVICGAVVSPARKASGVAQALIGALIDTAVTHGLSKVIAPVRPTLKHRYPLQSIDAYAKWVRSDGLLWDPWLRLHVRMGGEVIHLAKKAQTMNGTVAQWEEWSGMELPESGDYVIPGGMALLHIDKSANLGTYVEPNVWIRHR
jgi:GNAT superfamily N-acetyltransferase